MPSAPAMRDLLVDLLRPAATQAVPQVAAPFQALEGLGRPHDVDSEGGAGLRTAATYLIHRCMARHGLGDSTAPAAAVRTCCGRTRRRYRRTVSAPRGGRTCRRRPGRFARYGPGRMHRLRLAHPARANCRYRAALPLSRTCRSAAATQTLMKTAPRACRTDATAVRFGANARLDRRPGHPDANAVRPPGVPGRGRSAVARCWTRWRTWRHRRVIGRCADAEGRGRRRFRRWCGSNRRPGTRRWPIAGCSLYETERTMAWTEAAERDRSGGRRTRRGCEEAAPRGLPAPSAACASTGIPPYSPCEDVHEGASIGGGGDALPAGRERRRSGAGRFVVVQGWSAQARREDVYGASLRRPAMPPWCSTASSRGCLGGASDIGKAAPDHPLWACLGGQIAFAAIARPFGDHAGGCRDC